MYRNLTPEELALAEELIAHYQEQIGSFVAAARRFCELVERHESLDLVSFATQLNIELALVYGFNRSLPASDDWYLNKDEEEDAQSVEDSQDLKEVVDKLLDPATGMRGKRFREIEC